MELNYSDQLEKVVIESMGYASVKLILEIDEIDSSSKNRSHRTSTFLICWTSKRAS